MWIFHLFSIGNTLVFTTPTVLFFQIFYHFCCFSEPSPIFYMCLLLNMVMKVEHSIVADALRWIETEYANSIKKYSYSDLYNATSLTQSISLEKVKSINAMCVLQSIYVYNNKLGVLCWSHSTSVSTMKSSQYSKMKSSSSTSSHLSFWMRDRW